MDIVKINLRTPVNGLVQLRISDFIEKNNEVLITLEDYFCYNINEGDEIELIRTIRGENGYYRTFNTILYVKFEDENHVIHTTLPKTFQINLDYYGWYKNIINGDESYYVIKCMDEHYLFGQDLALNVGQEVYFKDSRGNTLFTSSGLSAMRLYSEDVATVDDCLIYEEKDYTCNKIYDFITTYYYVFGPDAISKNEFISTDFNEFEASKAKYIETKYNPFYYYTINVNDKGVPNELDSYGNPIRHCIFYGDKWFSSLRNTVTRKYINSGESTNGVYFNMSYYNASVGISSDSNESVLGSEDYFSESFATNVENSLIPPIIDMERIKYAPYEKTNNNSYKPLLEIKIYPHFRKRVLVDLENNTNTLSTSGNLYYDGWYIDNDDYNSFWNGFTGNGSVNSISTFVRNNGKIADLIGFLNFTNNDIFYSKHKVSKSFYRLLFYDSKDPIEQKLLYYSTVFIDGTELLSKYLKQLMFMEDSASDVVINEVAVNNKNVDVVFCENNDVGCRLDTTITITNEYDKQRCSEGFNIYLFKDDAPEGNISKTIYMKVEFNHAGNGKTIPLIRIPTTEKLTIENFFDYLYIPIEIRKNGEKYIYTIDGADYADGAAELCLFEPKLEV